MSNCQQVYDAIRYAVNVVGIPKGHLVVYLGKYQIQQFRSEARSYLIEHKAKTKDSVFGVPFVRVTARDYLGVHKVINCGED